MSRYYHAFPPTRKRQKYSALFNNDEDKAKLAYNKDMEFRRFVQCYDIDNPTLFGWTLADFFTAYKKSGWQLSLTF